MQNEAQYDLDRKPAKISALSSNNLDKYEYFTGEDLGLKPSTIEQAKFGYSPLCKIFNKGLDENDLEEGLLKRLKNIENVQKNLIKDNNDDDAAADDESISYTLRSQFDSNDDEDKGQGKQQNINTGSKSPNAFDYLKGLSQEAKDLVDGIEDANKDIDIKNRFFIGSNWKKFNSNTFRMLQNFLSDICNGEIKRGRISSKKFREKEIEELRFNQKPKDAKEEEKLDRVSIQANNMLQYRDKIIEAFKDGTFSSEHLKKSDDTAYDYVLKDVKNFIQKIKSMA